MAKLDSALLSIELIFSENSCISILELCENYETLDEMEVIDDWEESRAAYMKFDLSNMRDLMEGSVLDTIFEIYDVAEDGSTEIIFID